MNWLAVAQLEQNQKPIVVPLGDILDAWLQVRVPLAMQAKKAQYNLLSPEERVQIWKNLQQARTGQGNLANAEIRSGDVSTQAATSSANAEEATKRQDLANRGAEDVALIHETETLEEQRRDQRFQVANSASLTQSERAQMDQSLDQARKVYAQTPGTPQDKMAAALATMRADSDKVLATATNPIHRGQMAEYYADQFSAMVNPQTDAEKAALNAARTTFFADKNVPVEVSQNGSPVSRDALTEHLRQTKADTSTPGGGRLPPPPVPVGGKVVGGQPVTTTAPATRTTSPSVPAPEEYGTEDAPAPVTTGETTPDGEEVTGRFINADGIPMVTISNGGVIPDPRAGLTGNIPVAREGIANAETDIGKYWDILNTDTAARSNAADKSRIALKLFDTGPHPMDATLASFGQRYNQMTPEQQAALRARVTSRLNAIAPKPPEPTPKEKRAAADLERGDINLAENPETGGPMSVGVGPAERAKLDATQAAPMLKAISDDYARIEAGIRSSGLEDTADAAEARAQWFRHTSEALDALTPDAQLAALRHMTLPTEVSANLAQQIIAKKRAAPPPPPPRQYDSALDEDNAETAAGFDAAAKKAVGTLTDEERKTMRRRVLAPDAEGDDMGKKWLATPEGEEKSKEALGIEGPEQDLLIGSDAKRARAPKAASDAEVAAAWGIRAKPNKTALLGVEQTETGGRATLRSPRTRMDVAFTPGRALPVNEDPDTAGFIQQYKDKGGDMSDIDTMNAYVQAHKDAKNKNAAADVATEEDK